MKKKVSSQEVKEFKVNDFITLKLENGETEIYVKGEKFIQCKKVALNVPIEESIPKTMKKINKNLEEVKNIDELEEMGRIDVVDIEQKNLEIPLETKFFVHCSNMQYWAEENYDCLYLHSNLAFPLLKKLFKAGDPLAKKTFKEEIAKRLLSNDERVITFLLEEDYLFFLVQDEFESIVQKLSKRGKKIFYTSLFKKTRYADNLRYSPNKKEKLFNFLKLVKEKAVEALSFITFQGEKFFITQDELYIDSSKDSLIKIPILQLEQIKGLETLINLKKLSVINSKISKISGLENLINLEILNLERNQIEEINGLDNLGQLQFLNLDNNSITEISGLDSLVNLESLSLANNKIKNLDGLGKLKKLKRLHLRKNNITKIPDLEFLENLEFLNISENNILRLEGLEKLKTLSTLYISLNPLEQNSVKRLSRNKNLKCYF